ncbi:aquaporin-like protein [Lentithecium fluviatile CBS 122367]|uniref:Aquaporin-like protein n=1 Tax=Lentithecium fluviatile CBS 122367 TaxID=1168545 RepID=A0A6G1JKX2_9PLEO|nr:aquaporin-like protein [Lentithecium fluviatile CBS 122367]
MDDKIDSSWRRRLRKIRNIPVLPHHNGHDLHLTTSEGKVYIIDQFNEKVPMTVRNHIIAMLSEFVGTFLFIFVGLGGNSVVNNTAAQQLQPAGGNLSADPSKILFTAIAWGMSVIVNAWAFFRVSGGLFNPAVSIAMMAIRAISPLRGGLMIATQMVASIAAAAACYRLLPEGSLATTELGTQTSVVQGLFIEMFLTAQVVLAVFMLATEKHKATYIAPVGIGLAVFATIMMGAAYTGASLNPARSFAVCVVLGSFASYHWIYWLGPAMGSLLAVSFYLLIRKLEYWTVNPDVDTYETKVGHDIMVVKDRV